MASVKTKFTVGLFIALGLAITIIAIIWLGMSKYLEKGQYYVAYFNESVQGLERDSPVKYRGVPVGRVQSVGVAPDGTLVQVIMKIETKLGPESEETDMHNIVAQLKSVGITGIMFVELDQKKRGDLVYVPKLSFKPEYPMIATKPSEIKLFLEGVDDVLKQFKSIDGKGLTEGVKEALGKFDRAVDDLQIAEISAEIQTTLKNLNRITAETQLTGMIQSVNNAAQSAASLIDTARDTIRHFDAMLAANETGINEAVNEVDRIILNADNTVSQFNQIVSGNKQALMEAVSSFNRSAKSLENLLAEGRGVIKQGGNTLSELQPRLLDVMQQLEKTVQNLKAFSEGIARQPSQLLFGEPPVARPVEPD